MTKLTELMNIGPEMERKLAAAGIHSAEELRQAGAEQAYLRLKIAYPNVCAVHLYVLEGAILGIPYHHLPPERTAELKAFAAGIRG